MTTFIILVVVSVFIAITIGTLWYLPGTPTGKIHMRYLGFDKLSPEQQKQHIDAARPTMWKTYVGQMVLSLLNSIAVVGIVTLSVDNGVSAAMALSFVIVNWLCFSVPAIGGTILWGNCEPAIAWKKFFSDIGCILVTVLVVGLLTAYFA